MKIVQPIRDMDVLMRCYDIAREHDKRRKPGEVSWELLMVVGLNTSLRVSDLTRFRVRGQALPADESPQYHRLAREKLIDPEGAQALLADFARSLDAMTDAELAKAARQARQDSRDSDLMGKD